MIPADAEFRRLLCAQVIALVGTGLATIALGLLAYELAPERAAQVLGSALAVKMIAYVAVAPLVGAWVDRLPRRAVMVLADAARAVIVLALPFVTQIWQVYALIAVLQVASAIFTPTFQAVIADIVVGSDEYHRALSLSQTAVSLENIASPLIAAVVLTVVEFDVLFVATSVGFVASAMLVSRTRIPAARRSARHRFTDRLTAGTRIFAATPRLRAVLALNMVVAASGAVTVVTTVILVRDTFGGSDSGVALLLAAAGIGTAAAAIAIPRLLRAVGERTVMLAGSAVALAGMVGAVVTSPFPHPASTAVIWLALGVGGGLVLVPTGAVLRRSSSVEDRPAIFAAQFSLSHACWLITYPIAGWVSTAAGLTAAWSVLAVLVAVSVGLAPRFWRPGDDGPVPHRHLDTTHDDHLDHGAWDGHRWVHTHPVVIDLDHPRWPVPTR